MKSKAIFLLLATALIFTLGVQTGFSREKEETQLDAAKVMSKLDAVLANQIEILKQFAEIKQELNVIKIRASR